MDFFCNQFINKGRDFVWLRLNEASTKKLLNNNAEKLVDPDIRRKYKLDLITRGTNVYNVTRDDNGEIIEKKLFCKVLALSTFYSDKGNGLFDKDVWRDPNFYFNCCLDEFNKEKNEKSQGDILYQFVNELENLCRSQKHKIRVFCIANMLEEASDLLVGMNFIPEKFGVFKLFKNRKLWIKYMEDYRKCKTPGDIQKVNEKYKDADFGKRCVIEYIEPSEKYLNRRKGTIADILMPEASTFTNKIETDTTLIDKRRLESPKFIIKFTKSRADWFTVWNNNIITSYNGEQKTAIPMRPYLDEAYNMEQVKDIINLFDTRCFKYHNLITFKKFQKQCQLLKPRKQ